MRTGRLAGFPRAWRDTGPEPVHGARHDAHAYAASGLKDLLADQDTAADLGYLGVNGITTTPYRTPPGGVLRDCDLAFNKQLSAIRAAVERAVASVKTWRMLSEEGGRHRPPISKYGELQPGSHNGSPRRAKTPNRNPDLQFLGGAEGI